MAALRERLIPKGVGSEQWGKMTLMEKIKTSYQDDKMHMKLSRWPSRVAVVLFWYTTVTQLYCFLKYIIPEYFENYSDMTRYYMKIVFTFIIIQGSVNWLCVKLYDTAHRVTKDNPDSDEVLQKSSMTECDKSMQKENSSDILKNGDEITDQTVYEDKNSDRSGLLWTFCKLCNLQKPPRAHHCKICNVCILKRDHHCFFTNACVGFFNQRYFVILNFYIAIASALGMLYNLMYLSWKLGEDSTWWDYFLPQTIVNYWHGEVPLYYVYMVSHLYIIWWAGSMAAVFFVLQILAISAGKTTFEVYKQEKIRCTASRDDNFRTVFGAFWGLNFLFPAVLIFRQDGDGKLWKDVKTFK